MVVVPTAVTWAMTYPAIWIGLTLRDGPLETPHAAVAWISSVVGAHFLALATGGSEASAIDRVGGVLSGAILLAFGLWGSTRGAGSQPARAVP